MKGVVEQLQNPLLVCKFQSYFGVEKVREVEVDKNGSWNAVEDQSSLKTFQMRNGNSVERNTIYFKVEVQYWITFYDPFILSKVTNKFWYRLFILGSLLGHELWYAFFYSFLFWNVDAMVARKVLFSGNIIFYVGQVDFA